MCIGVRRERGGVGLDTTSAGRNINSVTIKFQIERSYLDIVMPNPRIFRSRIDVPYLESSSVVKAGN